jgi:hypothetical protein
MVGGPGSWLARALRLWTRQVTNEARTQALALDALSRNALWRPRGQNEAYVDRIVSRPD